MGVPQWGRNSRHLPDLPMLHDTTPLLMLGTYLLFMPNAAALQIARAPHHPCMNAAAATVSIEEAVSLFGRLADARHVFSEPMRTAASGFEFSENTAIKPKWLIGYASRVPCGEDVDLPTHQSRWSTVLFPDGASTCSRDSFDKAVCGAEYVAPLGTPKWAVPGQVLVDMKACAAQPSPAALDALWGALEGSDEGLQRDAVADRVCAWAKSDNLGEAVLFSEFSTALSDAA